MNLYEKQDELQYDNLIADNSYPILTRGIILAGGQGFLKRGTVVGKSGDKGYITGSTAESGNEGENAIVGVYGILADDADTGKGETACDTAAACYVSGVFNPERLAVDASITIKDIDDAMRAAGLHSKAMC